MDQKINDRVEEIARDLYSWGTSATYDMAGSEAGADEMWNDKFQLVDIYGDRIFDASHDLQREFGGAYLHYFKLICQEIQTRYSSHVAMFAAMEQLIRSH